MNAFDSSTIKLYLQLCPWARLHHDKGGVKMHTRLYLRGSISTFIYLTEAAVQIIHRKRGVQKYYFAHLVDFLLLTLKISA